MRSLSALLPALLLGSFLAAAPYRSPYGMDADRSARELHEAIATLKHQWRNHETLLRILQEQVQNQNETVEDLREECLGVRQVRQDAEESLVSKLSSIERSIKELKKELEEAKKGYNTAAEAYNLNQKQQERFQEMLHKQEDRLSRLQKALYTVMDELQVPRESGEGEDVYTVKPGDSLGAIALKYRTTIQKLKKINLLESDKIFPGQKLRLP